MTIYLRIGISEEIQRVASFPFVDSGTPPFLYVLATLSSTYFSPIFCGLPLQSAGHTHARIGMLLA